MAVPPHDEGPGPPPGEPGPITFLPPHANGRPTGAEHEQKAGKRGRGPGAEGGLRTRAPSPGGYPKNSRTT